MSRLKPAAGVTRFNLLVESSNSKGSVQFPMMPTQWQSSYRKHNRRLPFQFSSPSPQGRGGGAGGDKCLVSWCSLPLCRGAAQVAPPTYMYYQTFAWPMQKELPNSEICGCYFPATAAAGLRLSWTLKQPGLYPRKYGTFDFVIMTRLVYVQCRHDDIQNNLCRSLAIL